MGQEEIIAIFAFLVTAFVILFSDFIVFLIKVLIYIAVVIGVIYFGIKTLLIL